MSAAKLVSAKRLLQREEEVRRSAADRDAAVDENAKLKRSVPDLSLDKEMLQGAFAVERLIGARADMSPNPGKFQRSLA